MKKRTLIFAGLLILLALWLLMQKRGQEITYAKPTKVPGMPHLSYVVPPISVQPGGSIPNGDAWDWLGGTSCGCGTQRIDALIVDSIRLAPRTQPGYNYIATPDLSIPPALKGVPTLTKNPTMPAPIVYQAAAPSFWWGWQGLSRVIYTSDGFTLKTGLSNKLWTDVTPGRNALSVITRIRYNAQEYQLDAGRSVGL
jgi:hypothetical protein